MTLKEALRQLFKLLGACYYLSSTQPTCCSTATGVVCPESIKTHHNPTPWYRSSHQATLSCTTCNWCSLRCLTDRTCAIRLGQFIPIQIACLSHGVTWRTLQVPIMNPTAWDAQVCGNSAKIWVILVSNNKQAPPEQLFACKNRITLFQFLTSVILRLVCL